MARKACPIVSPLGSKSLVAAPTAIAKRLLAWFGRNKRDLPWRRTSDAYQIWISEIMLQQTQVATVVPYFERFVAAFPTSRDLAEADEHDVLRQWEGLGYYRRARQMHRAAQVLLNEHRGQFPRELDAIRALPGIGRYTAGAIASIAFDLPAPILEANTVRLFSRLAGFEDDPASSQGKQFLWKFATDVLPRNHCGQFNQALMELGSLVCTPRMPKCDQCPLVKFCVAFQQESQEKIPRSRPKPASTAVHEAAVVVWRRNKVLLRKRANGERWAGMWDFLRFPLSARRGPAQQQEILDKILDQAGLSVELPERITTIKHGVTRFRITLDCYSAQFDGARAKLAAGTWQWARPRDLEQLPLSMTGRKLARLLPATNPT